MNKKERAEILRKLIALQIEVQDILEQLKDDDGKIRDASWEVANNLTLAEIYEANDEEILDMFEGEQK